MTNYEIADQFSLLSKLMDLHGENSFKSKAYSIAAYHMERFPKEASEMEDAELFACKGIGESMGKKIRELQQTGMLPALRDIIDRTPKGVLEIMELKGLGPKKVSVIWKEMGIESVGELEYACNENRLTLYKGFGEKTQKSVLEAIAFMRRSMGNHLWGEVDAVYSSTIQHLLRTFPHHRTAPTGAMRRQAETVRELEIITDIPRQSLTDMFRAMDGMQVHEDVDGQLKIISPAHPVFIFHLSSEKDFYYRQFMTTGSEAFIAAFRKNFRLDEQAESEEALFEQNGLQFIPPPLRETAAILDKSKNKSIAPLIRPQDIKAVIHTHSRWSDGMNTIEEMAEAAIRQGFEYLVISDHSQSAYYAGGLKPEQVTSQHREIDALNSKLAPFRIFKSIEADILNDGSLDYTDEVLATFDLVIASVHSNLKMSPDKATARILKAIAHPYTTILGHPTGRLLLSREGYPLDHKTIIDACARHSVVIEINAHPRRLDLDWRWIEYATDRGVLLSIDPDAHSIAGFHDIYYGTMIAQKGGLTAAHNLSSFTLPEFEAFLAKNRAARNDLSLESA